MLINVLVIRFIWIPICDGSTTIRNISTLSTMPGSTFDVKIWRLQSQIQTTKVDPRTIRVNSVWFSTHQFNKFPAVLICQVNPFIVAAGSIWKVTEISASHTSIEFDFMTELTAGSWFICTWDIACLIKMLNGYL